MSTQAVFIDPTSHHFLNDELFNDKNQWLNRDGTLLPFRRLRDHLEKQGIPVHTADRLLDGSKRRDINHYWSLGILDGYKQFAADTSVRIRGFLMLEPPLVQPSIYKSLADLTASFESVYLHNIQGDGYSLVGVDQTRLQKLYWPQPYSDIVTEYWSRLERLDNLVVIAGAHNPRRRKPEFYSQRIKAVAELSEYGGIHLYGRGWDRWWSRNSLWWPYWHYRRQILASYRGPCISKLETLSQYRFSLCFENMPMSGYITEKIFDCIYAGTVPIYWGAPDIGNFFPPGSYVDMREFRNYKEMYAWTRKMSNRDWCAMRKIGREFMQSKKSNVYYNSLLNIIKI